MTIGRARITRFAGERHSAAVMALITGAAGREGESRCCGISCMDSRARLLIEDGGLEDERDSDLEERFAMTGFLRRP